MKLVATFSSVFGFTLVVSLSERGSSDVTFLVGSSLELLLEVIRVCSSSSFVSKAGSQEANSSSGFSPLLLGVVGSSLFIT